MNRTVVGEKIEFYTAKLDATRRQLDVVKTSFFKAKTATTKIKWPNKPPTERMRLLLRIVSSRLDGLKTYNSVSAVARIMGSMSTLQSPRKLLWSQVRMVPNTEKTST